VTEGPAPTLTPDERQLFERGIEEFNAGYFFECHETLEDLWTGVRGPARDFYQGLIQIAVALYHLGRGNLAGSSSLFKRGLNRLDKYPERYGGIELGALRDEARAWQARVESGLEVEPALAALPKVRRIRTEDGAGST
jgi:predicted metal-dependent hydrolase